MTFTLGTSQLNSGLLEPGTPRTYVRPYTEGFADGTTAVTAEALNTIDTAILAARNRIRVVASVSEMPSTPAAGDLVYRSDLQEFLLYRSTWGPMTPPGSVLQTVWVRSDARTTWSSAASGNGTTINQLNLTITPRYSNSHVICKWMINGELHQDNLFLVHKDGALVSNGYNTTLGNTRTSGMMSAFYDQNENSTPSNWLMTYVDTSLANTNTRTYAPAVRGSGPTAYTFYLNRSVADGADNNEVMVSMGYAMEIQQ